MSQGMEECPSPAGQNQKEVHMMRCMVPVVCALSLLVACGASPARDGGTGGGSTGGGTATGGGSATDAGTDAGTPRTWYKDVQPIVLRSCVGCHATGGIAPFPLETFAQAQPRAAALAGAVAAHTMPPWMPDESCGGPILGSRMLPPADIATFQAWSAQGALEGNPADAPPPPDAGLPTLPNVDATLAMTTPYTPSATLVDDYRCFVLDPALSAAKQVTGYDISPGVRAEVHHVIIYVVDRAEAVTQDATDAEPGWQCFGGPGVNSTGALGAWAPGSGAVVYPVGGIALQPGQALAMQIHYNTSSGTRVADTSSVKLMYARQPTINATLFPLVASGFAIPPNSVGYEYTKAFPNTSGAPLKVWGLLPHMHTLGRRITIKGASSACLVDIPKWDFHWQQSYFRSQPHLLGVGQALSITCQWDNPRTTTVRWGEGTADEMCFAYAYATP